ncbi:hypothetical protein GCM10020254_76880 [Streptomyces goshikiensis]
MAQGAASALMLPQVLATIQATTQGPRRARAMSLYGATAGLSMVTGQILGGVLVAADIAGTSWRAVFLVNVPVVLVGLVLAVRAVPETRSDRPASVDVPGTLLLALSLLSLLLPLTEGRAAGWPLWTWVSLAVFPFAAAAFYLTERRADRLGRTPLVPPSLLRLESPRRGLMMVVPFSIGFSGFMFVIAVVLQQGLHKGPVAAGLALVPMALAFFAASSPDRGWSGGSAAGSSPPAPSSSAVGIGLLLLAVQRDWPGLGFAELAPGVAVAGLGRGAPAPGPDAPDALGRTDRPGRCGRRSHDHHPAVRPRAGRRDPGQPLPRPGRDVRHA